MTKSTSSSYSASLSQISEKVGSKLCGTISTVVMPSDFGTERLRARSSNITAFGPVIGMEVGEALIGLARRLRRQAGGDDVEYVVEMVEDAELARGALGMAAVAVGEDEFAARQLPDRSAQHRIRHQPRIVDVVHLLQEIVGIDAVPLPSARERRAVFAIELLLQLARLLARQASAAPTHRTSSSRRSARTGSSDADRACCRGRTPSR